jgi:DNA-binding transcriptional MocR family regulator
LISPTKSGIHENMSTKSPSAPVSPLTDRVGWLVERLSQEITDGALRPGEKLNEPKLSHRFGVSRAPLREAIGRLEGQRLVVRTPRQGVRVATLALRNASSCFTYEKAWKVSPRDWRRQSSAPPRSLHWNRSTRLCAFEAYRTTKHWNLI